MLRNRVFALVSAVTLVAAGGSALAQVGTAITYQGQLKNSGAAVNSATDLQFSLWTAASGGSQVGSTVTSLAVPVAQGLFTAPIDFGVNPYTADQALWLQIAVRNPAGSGSYVPMGSRQLLTPSPFSLATRGMIVDPNGSPSFPNSFASIGSSSFATTLQLNDIANAKWRLNTGGFNLNFQNDDGGTFNNKMSITNTGSVGIGTTVITPGTRLSMGNSLPVTNVPTFAMYDGGVGNSYGLGMEGGAMTFWAGPGVKAKVRADGVFEVKTLQINGGSDLVEGFDSQTAELEPGTLMVIDPAHPGQLMPSTSAYDSKVAGIVSGANGVNPGIKMGQDGVMDGKNPIAMTGRVYVKCTTANGNIQPGDLLTTSDLAGHAMKASDFTRGQGAVVGKAMSALDKDTGLVLVLVNLQ